MAERAFDLVIRGGRVIDGSGGPAFTAAVGVKDGLIAAERNYWNQREACQQMGLLPAIATA